MKLLVPSHSIHVKVVALSVANKSYSTHDVEGVGVGVCDGIGVHEFKSTSNFTHPSVPFVQSGSFATNSKTPGPCKVYGRLVAVVPFEFLVNVNVLNVLPELSFTCVLAEPYPVL